MQGNDHEDSRPLRSLPDYIACLNKQDWSNIGKFVHEDVHYNGKRIGLSGYREMLEGDFRTIRHLYSDIQLLISEPPRFARRLRFDCTPERFLFGLRSRARRSGYRECLPEFLDGRIANVC
jgi:predicted ester cyclase